MKGWYGESARHSLAARGITYLYHGTTTIPLRNIKKKGLIIKNPVRFFEGSGNYIYFMEDEDSALQWADINLPGTRPGPIDVYEGFTEEELKSVDMVLLRVKKKDIRKIGGKIEELGYEELVDGIEVRVDVDVPPDMIEIWDGKWESLT